ncbi:hypothetical protein MTP99_011169 [Tenebrio molitor]|nr:hypothetical protein MTP99_011169 [Tenebrio molitor]
MTEQLEFLTCRRILVIFVIMSFLLQQMLRTNMSIAIVDMVITNHTNTTEPVRFHWTEYQKNNILGCIFWGYSLCSLIGGRLSEIYGSRIVLGSALLSAGLFTILTPLASYLNYYLLVATRVALGGGLGIIWPSVLPLAHSWIAPTDSSKFMSHTLSSHLGTALVLASGGLLVDHLGWPSIFYVTGGVTLMWGLAWFYFVYDSPGQHPRMSQKEREEIKKTVGYEMVLTKTGDTPWTKILTSGPVWAIVSAQICLLFNVNTSVNHVPSYMDQVLHFNIKQNGLLSSLPYIGLYSLGVVAARVADKWRKSQTFSLISIRRIFSGLPFFLSMLLLTIESFWGYDPVVSIFVFTLWQTVTSIAIGGHIANVLDISPTYSATIYGMGVGCGSLISYLATGLVSYFTDKEQNFEQWRCIFWVLIGVNAIGFVVYLVFSSADVQNWDPQLDKAEMMQLKDKELTTCR